MAKEVDPRIVRVKRDPSLYSYIFILNKIIIYVYIVINVSNSKAKTLR